MPSSQAAGLPSCSESRRVPVRHQDFLTLWKDADPDTPILQETKAEYAKLLEIGENIPTN